MADWIHFETFVNIFLTGNEGGHGPAVSRDKGLFISPPPPTTASKTDQREGLLEKVQVGCKH